MWASNFLGVFSWAELVGTILFCQHQDCFVPFALDPRLPMDILYLLFEEDFRFEQPEEEFESREMFMKSRAKLPPCASVASNLEAASASAATSAEPQFDHGGSLAAAQRGAAAKQTGRLAGTTFELASNASGSTWKTQGPTDYLKDLVQIATAACRAKRGNFIWAGWVPGGPGTKPHSTTALNFGSHLIILTKAAAWNLANSFLGMPGYPALSDPGHIDLILKVWCRDNQERFGCCYIQPAIGNYTAHVSGCSSEHLTSVRPNGWGDRWTRQGTRKEHDLQGRPTYLCGWTTKGNTEWLCKIDVPDNKLNWRTCWGGVGPRPGLKAEPQDTDPAAQASATAASSSSGPAVPVLTARAKRLARSKRATMGFRNWVDEPNEVVLGEQTLSSGSG